MAQVTHLDVEIKEYLVVWYDDNQPLDKGWQYCVCRVPTQLASAANVHKWIQQRESFTAVVIIELPPSWRDTCPAFWHLGLPGSIALTHENVEVRNLLS